MTLKPTLFGTLHHTDWDIEELLNILHAAAAGKGFFHQTLYSSKKACIFLAMLSTEGFKLSTLPHSLTVVEKKLKGFCFTIALCP